MSYGVPPIDDPLGRHWTQPDLKHILIDDTHAVMSEHAFGQLLEYSASLPTGVYPGKMWRRHNGAFDRTCKPENRKWLLAWYDVVPDNPNKCSINFREILIVKEQSR